jgi:iron complex transport system substrate-binding protein
MRRALLLALSFALCAAGADVPRRIVSLSPNVTELLYGVGAFGQVVGISDYCTYPPEVTRLPSVGGWHTPSLERLAGLRPDLVIVDDGQAPFVENNMKSLGLKVMIAPTHTIEDVYKTMLALGRTTGHTAQAERLIAETKAGLLSVAQKTKDRPKPNVVLLVSRTPGTLSDLYVATPGGFLAELVSIAGGRIIGTAAATGYGKLSKEDLLAMNPEIILEFTHGMQSRFAGDPLEAWGEMPELKAVRSRQVHGVDDDFVPHASQRMVLTAALFARLLHPEVK